MAEAVTKFPAKTDIMGTQPRPWYPFEALRREVDRLVSEFDDWRGPVRRSLFDYAPFGRFETRGGLPAIDIEEKAGEYEITAELPGLDEKDVELKVANGVLTIRGEKRSRRKKNAEASISPSAVSGRSNAHSCSPKASTPRRSRRASNRAC